MNTEIIKQQLSTLRLGFSAKNLEEVIGKHKKAVSLGWLSELLQLEIDQRKENSIQTKIRSARFPEITTLEAFDFSFNPKIDKQKILELASLKFLDHNGIALFLGTTGAGKTHLAIAIGVIAARAGHKVFATSAKRLNALLLAARHRGTLDELFKKILSAKLWILDDWGMVSFPKEVSEEIFDLFDRRKFSSAMILTSNRDVNEWPQVFHEPVLASAAIDRIFDRADISIFEGPSYRLKGKIQIKEIDSIKSNH